MCVSKREWAKDLNQLTEKGQAPSVTEHAALVLQCLNSGQRTVPHICDRS
jgi:hypothetical protein